MVTTLKDVADRAGVSVRTVSYAVTNPDRVSAKTLARVQALIQEMHYEPNHVARSLRTGRSGLIGLIVPNLQAPYFAEVAREFVSELARHRLTLVIDQTDGDAEREREFVAGANRAATFDGLIVSPLRLSAEDLEKRSRSTPIVLLGERILDSNTDHVAIDNVAAAYAATRYLLDRGYRQIAPIGPLNYDVSYTTVLRFQGYARALEEAGLDPHRYQVKVNDLTRAEGREAMAALLNEADRPDAVFCFSDPLALGALRAAHELGVNVPNDLGVFGFDDVEDGRYSTPSLSTVSPDKRQLARDSVQLLLDRINDPSTPPEFREVPFELTARESTR